MAGAPSKLLSLSVWNRMDAEEEGSCQPPGKGEGSGLQCCTLLDHAKQGQGWRGSSGTADPPESTPCPHPSFPPSCSCSYADLPSPLGIPSAASATRKPLALLPVLLELVVLQSGLLHFSNRACRHNNRCDWAKGLGENPHEGACKHCSGEWGVYGVMSQAAIKKAK